jgi:hypothetical protein
MAELISFCPLIHGKKSVKNSLIWLNWVGLYEAEDRIADRESPVMLNL